MSLPTHFLLPLYTSIIIIVISFLTLSSNAQSQNTSLCSTTTCGTTTITYPFRLASDPPHCGFPDPLFALDCQNNRPIFTAGSQRYNVQSISYTNYSIRLADPGLQPQNYSTCPSYSSMDDTLSSLYFTTASNVYNMYFTFITCSAPVNNPSYVDDPTCGNATAFSNSSSPTYSYIGRYISRSELGSSCVVNKESQASSMTPFGDQNYPSSTVHDFLSHGFQLTWYRVHCADCDRSNGRCVLERNNEIRCRHYCYEDTPLKERSFRCKFEYYAPFIFLIIVPSVIGGILVLRFIFVVSFLIYMVISRRRKQAASMAEEDKTIESIP